MQRIFFCLIIALVASFSFVSAVPSATCVAVIGYKFRKAECPLQNLDQVPSYLDKSIKLLNLSHNRIDALNSQSLAPYSSLKELYLNVNYLDNISSDAFSSLSDLRVLDLSYNVLSNLPNLPSSLSKLIISGNKRLFANSFSYAQLANLKSLEELIAQYVGLKEFPRLQEVGSSLKTLDIRKNDIMKFGVADLAQLCNLKNLFVGSVESDTFKMDGAQCACKAVKEWMREFAIGGTKIICADGDSKCDVGAGLDEFKSQRTKCQVVSSLTYYSSKFWYVGILIVILFLIFVYYCCVYRRRRRRHRRNRREKMPPEDSDSAAAKL